MNVGSEENAPREKLVAVITLVLMIVLIPVVVYGARGALGSTSNDPRQWLPRSFAETDTYDWFEQHFGTDEVSVVSWPGCTLKDQRVPDLTEVLEESEYFDRVLTAPRLINDLKQLGLSRLGAERRLRGILVGPDGKTTCLVLFTSAVGKADRSGAVATIERLAENACGLTPDQLRLAGPTVDAAAIDAESRRLLFQLAAISAVVSFVVASLRMRSIRMAIIVLAVAGYSTGVALAALYYSGGEMNLLMTMLPPLIYVLSISSAVHLANYYRDAVREEPRFAALRTAVGQGWTPCMLAAVTTAIGLVSLVMSKIDPIRMFGLYAAVGVIASVGVLFLLLPAALRLFPPSRESITADSRVASRFANRMIIGIARQHLPVMLACLALMGMCAWALPSIQSTVKLQDRFLESSDVIADYRWLEDNIGPMVPLEVVLAFDPQDTRSTVDRMRVVSIVQSKIQSLKEPVATMSAINLSPPIPGRGSSVRNVVQRKVFDSDRTRERLTDANFLAEEEESQLWRISIRANAIGDLDYGIFSEAIRGAVDPLLEHLEVEATYTGVIPLIYKAQRQLLQDLVRSFLAAFAVIAVVLILVLRSVSAAMLAMIPNLFPAVVVFGGIEWINIPVQIGSVMTASAALGIAVDDTVHFLTWFRRGLDAGRTRRRALYEAFLRCAGAMAHTTFICSAGLLAFAFSSFVPILHFAWLMVFLLLSALVGDLILLPAILSGPLGQFFERGFLGSSDKVPPRPIGDPATFT